MFSFLINFFSKFTWKQNLAFFGILTLIIGVIGYYLYYYQYKKYIANNDYNKMKIKSNLKEKVNFLKKNNYIKEEINPLLDYCLTMSAIDSPETEEKIILKNIKEKYSSMITDEYFITNKLNKIKKINYDKNKGIKFIETGKKAFNIIAKKLFVNSSMFVDDGCLVIMPGNNNNDITTDIIYVDILIDYKNYGIGIVFLPFHKVFYPNSFYKSEEEFLCFKEQFSELLNRARTEFGIYIFQVPEKLYNLDFDNIETKSWSYVQNYTPEEEEAILDDENHYLTFLSQYFEKVMTSDDSFRIFMEEQKNNNSVHIQQKKKAKIFY